MLILVSTVEIPQKSDIAVTMDPCIWHCELHCDVVGNILNMLTYCSWYSSSSNENENENYKGDRGWSDVSPRNVVETFWFQGTLQRHARPIGGFLKRITRQVTLSLE